MAKKQKHHPGQIHRSEGNPTLPETARVYERSHPANEAGMGEMENEKPLPGALS